MTPTDPTSIEPFPAGLAATPRDADGRYRYRLYVDGRFVDPAGGRWMDTEDPVAGSVWARVPRATSADADAAVEAARRALVAGACGRSTRHSAGRCCAGSAT